MRRAILTWATIAGATWGSCYSPTPAAASVSASCDRLPDGNATECTIFFSGRIIPGDAARLLEVLRRAPSNDFVYGNLVLNSQGGDVEEALRIAELVKSALLSTSLTAFNEMKEMNAEISATGKNTKNNERRCVSSCVLIWIAGKERGAAGRLDVTSPAPFGELGLHRPYFSKEAYAHSNPLEISRQQNRIMALMRDYLVQEGMSSRLVEKMMRHSSREVHWVSFRETAEMTGSAAWWQELMISRCGEKPEKRLDVAAIMRGEKVDMAEVRRVADCKHKLVIAAQKKFQQPSR